MARKEFFCQSKRLPKALLIVFSVIFCVVPVSRADILDDLDTVLNNFSTYYSPPSYFKGPGATYVNFGSFRTYVPNKTYRIISVTPPSLRATCGGIDVFMGGFSFINLDQFPQMLQQIMASAAGYFFQLALEQLCPTCANVMNVLRHAAQLANKFALDSCGMGHMLAEKLVNTDIFKEVVDDFQITAGKSFLESLDKKLTEWAEGDFSSAHTKLDDWKNKAKTGDSAEPIRCGNLVYLAVARKHGASTAVTLSKTADIMSVAGAPVLLCGDASGNHPPVVRYFPPLIKSPEVIIKGCKGNTCQYATSFTSGSCSEGQVPFYTCDADGCMSPSVTCKNVLSGETLRNRLVSLIDKMTSHSHPTPDEMALYYYTPYLSEIYESIRIYPSDIKETILYSYAYALGKEGLLIFYVRGYYSRLLAEFGGQVTALSVAYEDAYKQQEVFANRYHTFLEEIDRLAVNVEKRINNKVQVYTALRNLRFKKKDEVLRFLEKAQVQDNQK